MALIRVAGPGVEPLNLDEIKAILHVDYDKDDDAITSFIAAARDKLERRCGRAFVQQTWEMRTDAFASEIELPLVPATAVSAITYYDADGDVQTIDPVSYAFIDGGDDGKSSVVSLTGWPEPMDVYDRPDAVTVAFTAGYRPVGVSPDPVDYVANIPDGILQAMRWLVGHFFSNRESVVLIPARQLFSEVPDTVDAIIAPFIVPRL